MKVLGALKCKTLRKLVPEEQSCEISRRCSKISEIASTLGTLKKKKKRRTYGKEQFRTGESTCVKFDFVEIFNLFVVGDGRMVAGKIPWKRRQTR